jgi:replication factor C subunit 3/5
MFLVDKYYKDCNNIIAYQSIINKIIDSFDNHQIIYKNIDNIINLPLSEITKTVNNLESGVLRFSNFQHLILYGPTGSSKEYLLDKILEKIYGKNSIELKDVEYVISSYSNTKTKIMIKQSKYHIIIEPNTNGFDKYLIQEIIQDYAKSELLNIMKYRRLFKVVVINKIDNLSYYAQASLRRTMEKYSNTCKFILISDQLSKIIEPIRSRCLMIRVPLPNKYDILQSLLHIINKENIKIPYKKLYEIVSKSDNKLNYAIWLLDMYNYNIEYDNDWELIINNIIMLVLSANVNKIHTIIKKFREYFYTLFITNIPTQLIIKKIMIGLINNIDNINTLKLRHHIIDITSIFEQRISQGTRHIIHMEAYIVRLIYLLNNYNKGTDYNYNLDVLEI